jgi:hypothetical protein
MISSLPEHFDFSLGSLLAKKAADEKELAHSFRRTLACLSKMESAACKLHFDVETPRKEFEEQRR